MFVYIYVIDLQSRTKNKISLSSWFNAEKKMFNKFSLGGVAVQFFFSYWWKVNIKIWHKWLKFVIYYLKGGRNNFFNVNTNLFLSDWYMLAKRKLVGGGLMNFSVKNPCYYNEIN